MKIHCTQRFLRAAVLAAIIYGGNTLAQACTATWTGDAGNGA